MLSVHLRRALVLALCLLPFGIPASAPASAGCPSKPVSQVFLPWADPAYYSLVPDGGFEVRGGAWQLSDGARFVDDNESFYVRAPGDTWSLVIRAGASATSAPVCIGLDHPTLRLFARTTGGGMTQTLQVYVDYTDLAGFRRSQQIAVLGPSSSWTPTLPIPITTNAIMSLTSTNVRFRFEAPDGDWRVDDVYVDPYGKG
jgi:hypothetical protein